MDSREAEALLPHISQIVLEYGFKKVHKAHDHIGFDDGEDVVVDDDTMAGSGCAERQISQCDFWEGGLMNVHIEHVQEDISERVFKGLPKILRGRRKGKRIDCALFGNEGITNFEIEIIICWRFTGQA